MDDGNGLAFEHVRCGCQRNLAVNIPHWLVTEALQTGATVEDTGNRMANRPAGRQLALRSTAKALTDRGLITDPLPHDWTHDHDHE